MMFDGLYSNTVDPELDLLDISDFQSLGEGFMVGEEDEDPTTNLIDDTLLENLERAFFDRKSLLISHQLKSFDEFMGRKIQKLTAEIPELEVSPSYGPGQNHRIRKRAEVRFRKVAIMKPATVSKDGTTERPLFPNEARLRKMTYSAGVYADLHLKVYRRVDDAGKGFSKHEELEQDELYERVLIGRIPVMVSSSSCQISGLDKKAILQKGQCFFDVGGYFIIKGSEKVIITQEERRKGFWCSVLKEGNGFQARFQTVNKSLELMSSLVFVYLRYSQAKKKGLQPYITVRFPWPKVEVDAIVVFRALGITTDKDLMNVICVDVHDVHVIDLIIPSLEVANVKMLDYGGSLEHGALDLLGKMFKSSSTNPEETPSRTLERCLFPHLGSDNRRKAMLLGYLVRSVLDCYLNRRKEDDKDDLKNKRLKLTGDILFDQFKSSLRILQKELVKGLQKVLVKDAKIDLKKHVDHAKITSGFEKAFATGNWARPNEKWGLKSGGMVVPLNRSNPFSTLCHLRQTELQVDLRAKLWDTRCPNRSHLGRFCIVQTPDGEKCGLVKSLAISSHVSLGSPETDIMGILKDYCGNFEDISLDNLKNVANVFLNGHWVAVYEQPKILAVHLRLLRRTSKLPFEVEIVEDAANKEVRIYSDSGRILRPLLIVKDRWPSDAKDKLYVKGKFTFSDAVEAGMVEFLGPEEEAGCMIAADLSELRANDRIRRFTHCELHPSYMFGLGASIIPFANHNHTCRVTHQSQKHGKQAIGYYTTCLHARTDTSGQNLFYPQKPLVSTRVACLLNKEEIANGQNAIVAVCPFLGFNQEDSIVMNQSSIDRGLFNSMHYRAFTTQIDPEVETLGKPAISDSRKVNRPTSAYEKLDMDGLPFIGAHLGPSDVIFGKLLSEQANGMFEDTSTPLKSCEKGRVDRVVLTVDGNEKIVARVILRERRLPIVGDKFSSMHGQKGVIGMTIAQDELPFTKHGIVPDILINPHAFPSRQTVGQLLETHLAKVAALKGERGNGTSYTHKPIEEIVKELHQLGFEPWGKEAMIHGQTGQMMEASIFIGPAFYQRLLKMAEDLIKYRRQGPIHPLTRQPVSDRKRHGGVKVGEMERDCLLAHGASGNVQERLFYLSDPHQVYICRGCNTMTTKEKKDNMRRCKFCKTSKNIVCVEMPYACKLLYQELLSMGIFLRFHTELA